MEHDRIPYSPIVGRPPLAWPDGARVAVWVAPNIEHYEYLPPRTGPRDPWPRMPHPDVLGYGSRDYGNRVGFWRMLDVFDRLSIPATGIVNVGAFERFPAVMDACEERGWAYACHGDYNTRYHWGLGEDQERGRIAGYVDRFRSVLGKVPRGWFSPALSHTRRTVDLVAEAGFDYWCDWPIDDQPFVVPTAARTMIGVPYSLDINDGVLVHRGRDGEAFTRSITDAFDTLYREGEHSGRVFCLALHPFVSGQPHRVRLLEDALGHIRRHDAVWWTTADAIADWYSGGKAIGS